MVRRSWRLEVTAFICCVKTAYTWLYGFRYGGGQACVASIQTCKVSLALWWSVQEGPDDGYGWGKFAEAPDDGSGWGIHPRHLPFSQVLLPVAHVMRGTARCHPAALRCSPLPRWNW